MEHLLKMVVAVQLGFENLRDKMREDRGVTAAEYGLILAGIAIAIVVIVFTLGDDIANLFQRVDDSINKR